MHSAFSHPFAPPTERTILRAALPSRRTDDSVIARSMLSGDKRRRVKLCQKKQSEREREGGGGRERGSSSSSSNTNNTRRVGGKSGKHTRRTLKLDACPSVERVSIAATFDTATDDWMGRRVRPPSRAEDERDCTFTSSSLQATTYS